MTNVTLATKQSWQPYWQGNCLPGIKLRYWEWVLAREIIVQLNENPSDTYQIVDNHLDRLEDLLQPLDSPAYINTGFRRLARHYQVKFGRILGMSNIILNARGFASIENIVFNPKIKDKIFDNNEHAMHVVEGRLHFKKCGEKFIKNGVFIGSHPNFGHWLFNHAARLNYVKQEDEKMSYIIQGSASQSQIDLIQALGIESSQIHRTEPGVETVVENLTIPQMPWHRLSKNGVWWSPASVKFLHSKLAANLKLEKNLNHRLFITRQNTRWRRIVNEDALYEIASKFGYERLDPGKISVEQQQELGQKTQFAISPLGANSNFFIFMPSGSFLFELAPPMNCMNVTGKFCDAAGINYQQMFGDPEGQKTLNQIDADYRVDEQSFRAKLEKMHSPIKQFKGWSMDLHGAV